MPTREIGQRVGAMSHANATEVYLFGFGVYEGDRIPDPAEQVCFMGQPIEFPNPCILLDNGKRVYGCECWWGSETEIATMIGQRQVIALDIEAARKAAA